MQSEDPHSWDTPRSGNPGSDPEAEVTPCTLLGTHLEADLSQAAW